MSCSVLFTHPTAANIQYDKEVFSLQPRPRAHTNSLLATTSKIPAHVETLIHADDMDSKLIDETGTSLKHSPEEASK